jgi:hypothetical protein
VKRYFLFSLIMLLFVLPFVSAASFNISERTEFGISENTVFLRVCDNVGKAQYIDVSSVFVDDVLTRGIFFDGALFMKQPYNNVVFENVLSSIGKYSSSNVSVMNNFSGVNYTRYFDSKGLEMLCESVLVDKSCMQTKSVNTYNFSSMEYQQLPVLKEKIVISGSKIEQKSLGIPLAKGGCVDLRYSYSHPLAYKLEVSPGVNKYDIWIDNGVESAVLDPLWFNLSWNNSKEINLSGVSANTTNYQLRLVIPKVANMNANFSDLRFLAPDNSSERPYWIETSNASQATVWLNVSIFNGTVAYMYYGNPNAVSTSNGTQTFLMFDDFDGTLNSNWKNTGLSNYANSGGNMVCGGSSSWCFVKYNNSIPYPLIMTARVSDADKQSMLESVATLTGTQAPGYAVFSYYANATDRRLLKYPSTWVSLANNNTVAAKTGNHTLELWLATSDKRGIVKYDDGTIITMTSTDNSFTNGSMFAFNQVSGLYIIWVFERTYLVSEPTVTFGSEMVSCVENLSNSSSVFVGNLSCLVSDLMNSSWNYTTFDVAACGFTANVTHTFYVQNTSCNFCSFNPQYLAAGDWVNVSCVLGDLMNQSAETIQYDANYSSCYALTNLSSDLWNGGVNISTYSYQLNGTCDFCTANLTNTSWSNWTFNFCMNTSYFNQSRSLVQYDVNGCVDEPNVTFSDYSYNSTACTNPSTVNINLGEIAIIFILALFALVLGLWGKQPVFLFVAALLFGVLSGMTWLSYGALLGVIFLVFTLLSVTLGLGMAWS